MEMALLQNVIENTAAENNINFHHGSAQNIVGIT